MCVFFSYRACYNYETVNDTCIIMDQVVDDILPIIINGSDATLYKVETPLLATKVYPSNIVCFFVIGRR